MATIKRIAPPVGAKKIMRVAAYARVSTSAPDQHASFSQQVSYYSRLIQQRPDWVYAGVYADEGISGTTTNRPQFQAMLTKATAGEIDMILTKSISRFARNTIDLLTIIRGLKECNVAIVFQRENINTLSAEGELLLTLLASFAQEESRSISQNVTWAIRKRFQNGLTNSFVIYGYAWHNGEFRIIDDEARVVRLLFDNYLKGISPEKTAAQLNKEGYRSRGGGPFRGSVMRRMLENERYMGCQMLQKTYTPTIRTSKRIINDGCLPRYWVEQALPAIIDKETFEKVQQEIRHRRAKGLAATPTLNTGPLTHKIRCMVCGKNYHRKTKSYPSGYAYHYWRCASACTGNGNPCQAHNLREEMIKDACQQALHTPTLTDRDIDERIKRICASRDELAIYHDNTTTLFPLNTKGGLQ